MGVQGLPSTTSAGGVGTTANRQTKENNTTTAATGAIMSSEVYNMQRNKSHGNSQLSNTFSGSASNQVMALTKTD